MIYSHQMDKITELITRGVDKIYPSKEELEKVLRSGKKLKLYQGFDPTGAQLHIGHMVGLRKLRQWQDLGHHVIFLIGDGTGQAGDPSGKKTAREKFFTNTELRENAVDYVKQAGKIVRFEGDNPVEILFNGDWLNKLTFVDILNLFGHLSLQQLEERDLFEERKKKEQTINMREFIYPVLQGYDSVAMKVDLEIGGSDQMFNMLVGRQLVKEILGKEKYVMTMPLLTDSQGMKIGKTEGNVIALTDKPEDLFRKIMALPDDVIIKALEYLTDVSMEEIDLIKKALESGENPMKYKKRLAFEITKQLNSQTQAQKAEQRFEALVQNKNVSNISVPEFGETISTKEKLVDVLVKTGFASSKSEAKRVIEQGGITVNNKQITDQNYTFSTGEYILGRANRKFIAIRTASSS